MFAFPLGLLALLAVPAVIALHLFRRRFRPQPVAALFLWGEVDATPAAGRRRERLVKSSSLWLETLAALLLGLSIAGPIIGGEREVPHLVAVLDGSASMSARGAAADGSDVGDATSADLARTLLSERIDALGGRARITLIESGRAPRLLAGPGAEPANAARALDSYQPEGAHHPVDASLALARDLAGDGGRVLFVTDHLPESSLGTDVEVLALGRALDNVGLVRTAREAAADSGRERVSAVIANFGAQPVSVTLQLEALPDESDAEVAAFVVGERTLELDAGERKAVQFELAQNDRALKLALNAPAGVNALALDDSAVLVKNRRRVVRVHSDLDADTAYALGFRDAGADPASLTRLLRAFDDLVVVRDEEAAELLLVADADDRRRRPGTTTLSIERPEVDSDAARAWVGPFLTERAATLMDGITLDGVAWTAANDFDAGGGAVLASAGATALVTREQHGAALTFRLNLDPERSTLARSPDWPILLSNLIELTRARLPGPSAVNLAVGDTLTVHRGTSAPEDARVRLEGPGVEREASGTETMAFDDLIRAGRYTLEVDGGEPIEIGVALNDARESDLTSRAAGMESGVDGAALASISSGQRTLQLVLAGLALVALLLDWWVLSGARLPQARLAGAQA